MIKSGEKAFQEVLTVEDRNEKKVALNDELLDRVAGGKGNCVFTEKCPACGFVGAEEEGRSYTCMACGNHWKK